MSFNIGDRVMVLDEDLSGVIMKVTGDLITIETEDGFLMRYNAKELIEMKTDGDIKQALRVTSNIKEIISEKEARPRKKQPKVKPKTRYEPTMEVDLHIHQLTKSTKGMTNHDMLTLQINTAKRQLEFAIRHRIQKIVFVHGVGEGVLKLELVYLFGRYGNVTFYDADYQKYGLGATEVYIYQNVKPTS